MENKPLIKWHAQELYKLLLQDQNDPLTVNIARDIKTVFLNIVPYKDIEAQPPEEQK